MPVAAHGIVVSPSDATTVPTNVVPSAHVALNSPVICEPVCDVIFHCMLPQLWAVGYDVTAGPFHVPRYDRTVVDELSLGLLGDLPRAASRPKQAVVARANIRMKAGRRYFMSGVSVSRWGLDSSDPYIED